MTQDIQQIRELEAGRVRVLVSVLGEADIGDPVGPDPCGREVIGADRRDGSHFRALRSLDPAEACDHVAITVDHDPRSEPELVASRREVREALLGEDPDGVLVGFEGARIGLQDLAGRPDGTVPGIDDENVRLGGRGSFPFVFALFSAGWLRSTDRVMAEVPLSPDGPIPQLP